MQKLLIAGVAAVTAGAAALAFAATPDENRPVVGAYFNVGFGGQQTLPRNFHYGLRLDHDRRFVPAEIAPLMQMDFDRAGLTSAKVNGMDMVSRSLVMRQDETTGEPGMFSTYTTTDWVLVGLGVVALGAGVAAIADGKDDPQPTEDNNDGGEGGAVASVLGGAVASVLGGAVASVLGGGGDQGGGAVAGVLGGAVASLLGGGGEAPFRGESPFKDFLPEGRGNADSEYRQWLDGGHGQMGDLGG